MIQTFLMRLLVPAASPQAIAVKGGERGMRHTQRRRPQTARCPLRLMVVPWGRAVTRTRRRVCMGNLEWANPVLRPEEDGRIAGEVRLEIDDTKPWSKLPYFPVGGPVMPETPTQGVRDAQPMAGNDLDLCRRSQSP